MNVPVIVQDVNQEIVLTALVKTAAVIIVTVNQY